MKTQIHTPSPSQASRLEEVTQYSEVKRMTDTLMALQREKSFHSLAVLSMFPGEGRTLFSAAVAIAYAGVSRSRVLVVDTTTVQHPKSLTLKQCVSLHKPVIDFLSLEEYRRGANGNGVPHSFPKEGPAETPPLEADLVADGPLTLMVAKKSDQSLIQLLAEEHAGQYGLIVLDTAPLTVSNKNNIDPLVVARMSDASILVISPRLLNVPALDTHLKVLKDPRLHLLGTVSNEEYFQ